VHIPFCETKCGYCDFYSVALKGRDTGPLVEAVIHECGMRLADPSREVRTVFLGGGTPTILPADRLAVLLEALRRRVPAEDLADFTVEANPATVDDQKARLLAEAGVKRVSLGAQSFFPRELDTLERIHSPDDIAPSVETLRRNGILQVNLDLIFGIPGQTMDSWGESLRRAVELLPNHVACYGLTYEPLTRLTALRDHGRLIPCDESLEADMYLLAMDVLESAGLAQYETSNFATPGCQSEHNLMYWRNRPYLGVGPSASGCRDGRRYKNVADVNTYVRLMNERGHAEAEVESIDTEMLMIEMVMMQLRLVEGLSLVAYRERTGADPLELFGSVIDRFSGHGVLEVSETRMALTRRGRLLADEVIRELACACRAPERAPSRVP